MHTVHSSLFRFSAAKYLLISAVLASLGMTVRAQVFAPVLGVDVSVSIDAPRDIVREVPTTYSFLVKNTGTVDESAVYFTDPLLGNFLLLDTINATCRQVGSKITCDPFPLPSGGERKISLVFWVPGTTNCTTKTVQHQAFVSASLEQPVDTGNNATALVKSNVLCSAPVGSSSSSNTSSVASVDNTLPFLKIRQVLFLDEWRGLRHVFQITVCNEGTRSYSESEFGLTDFILNVNAYQQRFASGGYPPIAVGACQDYYKSGFSGNPPPEQPGHYEASIAMENEKNTKVASTTPYKLAFDIRSSSSSSSAQVSSISSTSGYVDLTVSLSGPESMQRVESVPFTVRIENKGTQAEPSVLLMDPLQGSFLLTGSDNAVCRQTGPTVTCDTFALAPGESKTIALWYSVPALLDCTTKTAGHQVRVSGSLELGDRTNNNVSAALKTTILCGNSTSSSSSSSFGTVSSISSSSSTTSSSSSSSSTTSLTLTGPGGASQSTYHIQQGQTIELRANVPAVNGPLLSGGNNDRLNCVQLNTGSGTSETNYARWNCTGGYPSTTPSQLSYTLFANPFIRSNTLTIYIDTSSSSSSASSISSSSWMSSIASSASSQNSSTSESRKITLLQKSLGLGDTVVSSQKNVNLLRFTLDGSAPALKIKRMAFRAAQGSVDDATNYSLWVDVTGDGKVDATLEKGKVAQNGLVVFDTTVQQIQVLKQLTIEVHADIVAAPVGDNLALQFNTGDAAQYIQLEDYVTGAPLVGVKTVPDSGAETRDNCTGTNCAISVYTTSPFEVKLRLKGDLYVTRDSTPVRPMQLLAGELSPVLLRVQFHAENEDITVLSLGIQNDTSMYFVEQFEGYLEGSTTPIGNKWTQTCGSGFGLDTKCMFFGNGEFVIPRGADVDLLIRARIKNDSYGANAGDLLHLQVNPILTNTAGAAVPTVSAKGLTSGLVIAQNNNNTIPEGEIFIGTSQPRESTAIVGMVNYVTLSKISSITNSNVDTDGTAIPEGPSRTIGQFRFSAPQNTNAKNGVNSPVLGVVMFTINAQNVDVRSDSLVVQNTVDTTVSGKCYPYTLTGEPIDGTATGRFYLPCDLRSIGATVPSGASLDLRIVGEVTKVNPAPSAILQVSLDSFTSPAYTGFNLEGSHIYWLDTDTVTSTPFVWVDSPVQSVFSTQYQD